MTLFSQLSHRFANLGDSFSQITPAQAVKNPEWVSINYALAKDLNIANELISNDSFLQQMAGNLPKNCASVASVYSGHQFGGYTPQLGDGRALVLGDWQDQNGCFWELQLKGSGITAFSRFGDGRAVLRSSIREYLASAALQALDIPTTTALALINSQTPVQRETIESAAVVLRIAPSFIRFGHFEYFFYQNRHKELKQLADFTISHYFPDCLGDYAAWFQKVVLLTAEMIAHWQAQGFCHGVMNTDNMSILGITLDYGPFAFLDEFDPNYICNHSDHTGRYSFKNQPDIGLWNLNALAHALSPLIKQADLQQALSLYGEHLSTKYEQLMLSKLGLALDKTNNAEHLFNEFFRYLLTEKVDYSYFFRQLSETSLVNLNTLSSSPDWQSFLVLYRQQIQEQSLSDTQRMQAMQAANPKYILRSDLAEQAIKQAQTGDYQMVNDLLNVLQNPFIEHECFVNWSAKPKRLNRDIVISCSS